MTDAILLGSPRDDAGNLIMLGTGRQHWATVHVADPGSDDEARARSGDYFAEVLLLDQGTEAAKAKADLDWSPSHPGLLDEFRNGSYRNGGGNG